NGFFCEIRFKYTNGNLAEEGAVNQKFLLKQFIPAIIEDLRNIHNAGLVHGKIRPYNLFHSEIGSDIILGDFGIDEVRNSLENEEFITLAKDIGYLPPSAMNGVITKEDDYYALGMTLYQLATGIDLFNGLSDKELFKFAHTEYLNIRGNVDSMLANIIRGLTVKAKDERWGYTEVTRALQGEDVEINDDYVCDVDVDSFNGKDMSGGDVVLKTKKSNIIISKVNTVEEDYDYHNFFDTDDNNNNQSYFSAGFASSKIDDDEASIYERGLYDEDDDDDGIEYANSYSNPSPIKREEPKKEENFISREAATDSYGIDDPLNKTVASSGEGQEETKEDSGSSGDSDSSLSFDDLSFLDDIDDDDDFDIENLIKARLFDGKSAEETKELFTPKPKPKKEEPKEEPKPLEAEKEEPPVEEPPVSEEISEDISDAPDPVSSDSKGDDLFDDSNPFSKDKDDDLFGYSAAFSQNKTEQQDSTEEDDDLFGDSDAFGKMSESDVADDLFGDSGAFDEVVPKKTKPEENKSAFAAEVNKRNDNSFESKLASIAKDIEPENKPVGIFKVSDIPQSAAEEKNVSEHKPGIYKVGASETAFNGNGTPAADTSKETNHTPGIYKVDSSGNLVVEKYEPKKPSVEPEPVKDTASESNKSEDNSNSGIKILSYGGQKPTFTEKADFKPKNITEDTAEKDKDFNISDFDTSDSDIPIEESIEAEFGI
ncbi:MAG: hypothetical protein IJ736_13030, partial [Firmicutes bacterium]|nr:hypothetical protein [Bacillota bacterium]